MGDAACNLFWKTFEFFLIYFYTDVFGLTARSAARLLLFSRVADAITDPAVGYLADRTRTVWGSFRPYLLFGSLPLAVAAMLAFHTPDWPDRWRLAYAYATYIAVMVAYTVINVPYGALLGVVSSDSRVRTSFSTYRFVAAFAGGLVVQYFTLDLVDYFGRLPDGTVDPRRGFFRTVVAYSVAAVALFLIAFVGTRERVPPSGSADGGGGSDDGGVAVGGWRTALGDLAANRPWMALSVFGLLQLTGHFIRGGAVLFYFKYYVGDVDHAATFWACGSLASVVGMLPTTALTRRVSKRRLLATANAAVAATMAVYLVLPPTAIRWMLALQIVAGLLGGPIPVLVWSMYADVVDHNQRITGRRSTGLIFAAATFAQKVGCAVGAAAAGYVLDAYGYRPPVGGVARPQSPQTLEGLRIMMSVLPAGLLATASAALLAYRVEESE